MASPTCGFGDSDESLGGMNSYPAATRTHKLNVQVIHVKPLSSSFGDYVGGQKGTTVSTACSVFF